MLGSMRKALDKYQKYVLVALAAFLIAIFTLPRGSCQPGRSAPIIGMLYGKRVTQDAYNSLYNRWGRLGLPFVRLNAGESDGEAAYNTYLLLLAARAHGVAVGPKAVDEMRFHHPAQTQRIEYVIADPAALAADIKPTDEQIRAHYDAHWQDKGLSFERAKDAVRSALVAQLAGAATEEKMREAHALAAAAPARGKPCLNALRNAANALGLEYGQSRWFAEQRAAIVLASKAGLMVTDSDITAMFREPVGKPSAVITAGPKRFMYRVIESSAGFDRRGVMIKNDEGWYNDRFMVLETYNTYDDLVAAKRSMNAGQARTTFEEYLVVNKFIDLACAGSLLSNDAREQVDEFYGQEASALTAGIPVAPFVDATSISQVQILEFYNARKGAPTGAPMFNYLQPPEVQVEYIIAPHGMSASKGTSALGAIRDTALKQLYQEGTEMPFQPAVRAAGLEYKLLPSLSAQGLRAAAPEVAGVPGVLEQAFSREMAPHDITLDSGESVILRQISPTFSSGGRPFLFRLRRALPPRSVELAELSPTARREVERDYAHARAVGKAVEAARLIKAGIARQLLGAVAAENDLTVQTATISASKEVAGVPPALLLHVQKRGALFPGDIVRLLKDGDAYYTAVITGVDRTGAYNVRLEYIRFTHEQFTAAMDPPDDETRERARDIRDDELGEGEGPAEPTDDQVARARAQLVDEWKKKEFTDRYLDYLQQRLGTAFRSYIETHPLAFDRKEALRLTSTPFFHADDTLPLGGDQALIAAAFKLEPGQLAPPVTGESAVAVMLLAGRETRQERKIEFVSVRISDYDPLDVTVSEADAAAYHATHAEEFRRPARAKAEFVVASFGAIARAIEPTISDEQVQEYFDANRAAVYKDRALDEQLRMTIRRLLALKAAEGGAAEEAARAAHAVAANSPMPLENVAATLAPSVAVTGGTTPLLGPDDQAVQGIGYAPELVGAILAAEKGSLSEPAKTEDGWVVFRVVERTDSSIPSLEEALPAVRAGVRKARLTERARTALEKVRKYTAGNAAATLEDALNAPGLATGLPLRTGADTTGYVDRDNALGYGMTAALRDATFDAEPGRTTNVIAAEGAVQIARVIDAKTNDLVKVDCVLVPAELFAPFFKSSEEDARKQYEEHKTKYEVPAKYELEVLVPDAEPLQETVVPAEQEIADAYEQLKVRFLDTKRSRDGEAVYRPLEDVREALVSQLKERAAMQQADELIVKAAAELAPSPAGQRKPMKDVASEMPGLVHVPSFEYSPDAGPKPQLFQDVPRFDAFLASAKAGDMSPVLRTDYGPILIRVNRVEPKHVPPFEEVEAAAKRDVELALGLGKAARTAGQVFRQTAATTRESLEAAARQVTVDTKSRHELAVREKEKWTRLRFENIKQIMGRMQQEGRPVSMADYERLALIGELFGLRRGEITEPPVVIGERAESCFLATLVSSAQAPAINSAQAAAQAENSIRANRVARLVNTIRQELQRGGAAQ